MRHGRLRGNASGSRRPFRPLSPRRVACLWLYHATVYFCNGLTAGKGSVAKAGNAPLSGWGPGHRTFGLPRIKSSEQLTLPPRPLWSVSLEFTPESWLLAFLPILSLIVMMLVMRWGGTKAGPAGLAVAGLIAWARFGADAGVLWASLLRGDSPQRSRPLHRHPGPSPLPRGRGPRVESGTSAGAFRR